MLQDSLVTVPTPTTGVELLYYWITLVAGFASGYVVKLLAKTSELVGKLNEFLRLGLMALLAFGTLKVSTVLGLTLPSNPFEWSPELVNTVLATGIGFIVSKAGIKKQ